LQAPPEFPSGELSAEETDLTMTADASTDLPDGLCRDHVARMIGDTLRQGALRDLHVKSDLLNRINVIWVVQSLLQKYSDFQKTQISL
jgi:hypothetical protein